MGLKLRAYWFSLLFRGRAFLSFTFQLFAICFRNDNTKKHRQKAAFLSIRPNAFIFRRTLIFFR